MKSICECCNEIVDSVHDILRGKVYDLDFSYNICSKCIGIKYKYCSSCGSYCERGMMMGNICNFCVLSYKKRVMNNYSFKVNNALGESRPYELDFMQLLYGVELEYESENINEDSLSVTKLIDSFACLKKDVSLESGFEIVSKPMNLNEHIQKWEKFFIAKPDTVKVYRTCGMHVHVSKENINDLQIGKILCFIHNKDNNNFIKKISERGSGYHNDFLSPKQITHGKNRGVVPANNDRHTAVNVLNDKTIEFRLFRTPNTLNNFLKNLEFCSALVDFTVPAKFSVKESISKINFLNFIHKNKKKYPHLFKFLEKNKYVRNK